VDISSETNRDQVLNEIRAFQIIQSDEVKNQSIIGFHGVVLDEDLEMICLVLDLMDMNSYQGAVISSEKDLAHIARSTLNGLAVLHQVNVIHCDIKPANILRNSNEEVKIADLGIACDVSSSPATTSAGTQLYLAPERLSVSQRNPFTAAADIWSFGLTMITIATGTMPFANMDGFADLYVAVTMEESPNVPIGDFSPEFVDFISQCLKKDPTQRWTAAQLLNHPFLQA